jgi:hypothetical protein
MNGVVMRFPSLMAVVHRAGDVLRRFPWTMAAGALAAAAAIAVTFDHADPRWLRVAMVAALGLPLTIALTLFGEERRWPAVWVAGLNLAAALLLVVFYLSWPGPDRKHEAIRYFQLSASLHLLVATLPFVGYAESNAFWQFNRRLFEAILRSAVFSLVLFVGLAIALAALDKLFGVNVPDDLYGRSFLLVAFVINTAIFLAEVPENLRSLSGDRSYPKVLKVFAQYILAPIVFLYLMLLLAYLIKIIAGGEWPSGWIGWLVSSVAVAGLLGFLLLHPLRNDEGEGWIHAYTRWFFIGLVPAAVMLLVAFWKRVIPYGLTELRFLGLLLGLWLLGIALSYTLSRNAGVRRIPVTLLLLLLLTLYGPLSATNRSLASQGSRLKLLVSAGPSSGKQTAQEASAALRFLLEHGARAQVAAAIPKELPPVNWDSLPDLRAPRDSIASSILELAGLVYVPDYIHSAEGYLSLNAERSAALQLTGYEWMLEVSSGDSMPRLVGTDSVQVRFDTLTGVARVLIEGDTVAFDLRRLAYALDSSELTDRVPRGQLSLDGSTSGYRIRLSLEHMNGRRTADSLLIRRWEGQLFLRSTNSRRP